MRIHDLCLAFFSIRMILVRNENSQSSREAHGKAQDFDINAPLLVLWITGVKRPPFKLDK